MASASSSSRDTRRATKKARPSGSRAELAEALADVDRRLAERMAVRKRDGVSTSATAEEDHDREIIKLKLEKADCLSKLQHFKESLDLYSDCFNQTPDDLPADRLSTFVDTLSKSNSKSDIHTCTADVFSCPGCFGVLSEPVCLPCGHSCCRKCVQRELARPSEAECKRCRAKLKFVRPPSLHASVIGGKLVLKYWKSDLEALELRNEGNRLCEEGKFEEALQAYSKAVKLSPNDFYSWSNRSHAYLKSGQLEEALSDAVKATNLKPDWAKGHFRKAAALQRLDKQEEAFKALYQCLMLDDVNAKEIKGELVSTLHIILSKHKHSEDLSLPNTSSVSGILEEAMASAERVMEECRRQAKPREIDMAKVDKDDFECPLCLRLLFQPVTTPCGHTYCRMCLDRTLDHNTDCPMCKGSLVQYLAERRDSIDDFVSESILRLLPQEASERQLLHEKEMEDLAGAGVDPQHEIPVFVCTMSFPNIPCPLHVFEPRYRLMVRRCMEAGTREFGMCCHVDDHAPFADYGTMLEIRDIQYFPDGRAVVDTVGGRRFKVISRGVRDGYNTASVEFIKDDKLDPDVVTEVKSLHEATLQQARQWFNAMSSPIRDGILSHYGPIPEVEAEYWQLSDGPAWTWWIIAILPLDPTGQLQILSQTALKRRLEGIQRILRHLSRGHQ